MKWLYRTVEIPCYGVFLLMGFVVLCCLVTIMPRSTPDCPEAPVVVGDIYLDGLHARVYRQADSLDWLLGLNEDMSARCAVWRLKYFGYDGRNQDCADSIETLNAALKSAEKRIEWLETELPPGILVVWGDPTPEQIDSAYPDPCADMEAEWREIAEANQTKLLKRKDGDHAKP